ncbi:MAG: hypothetical protein ACK5Z2_09600 [Bacteroidota bacterium]|jgi:hypothetical protein
MLISFITLLTICGIISLLAFIPVDIQVEDYTDVAGMETESSVLSETLVRPQQRVAA